ncbi:peptide-methionine (S)-S-oxide reductase MsrA [Psittacicella gerlachiana]|uniref:Peptide methionine sulfoxide reductase MsrA n=1 Tax=Psittacicella gerlachiana TaxID=2028574 RepID=A0A3A1Y7J3_9GAMM|nr:peptide-methionine (S)-S-oxide reductase MsrA [Psittacicella gerlachiana]RIY34202.1 peptide-methionine (S)-S-oxide reductase [Psittacicella gerlachiana]
MAKKEIYLAGGCFWGTEKFLKSLLGVEATEVGFANGNQEQVSYKEVCTGTTAHVEAVKVTYDNQVLPLEELLEAFLQTIDPTLENQQGNDKGTQYRTGIYSLASDFADQKELIAKVLENEQLKYQAKIVVENLPLNNYCSAEEYHQKYLDKNPGGYCHLNFNDLSSVIETQNKKSQTRLK